VNRLIVEVFRDDEGRLHGTVEPDDGDGGPVGFTGVIELVATLEACLDQVDAGGDHPDRDDRG
jgi:hypothetical protein